MINTLALEKVPISKNMLPNFNGLSSFEMTDKSESENFGLHIISGLKQCIRRSWSFKLSVRESECLILYLLGKSTKEIGNDLGLSSRTVESYIENTKAKLGSRTKAEMRDFFLKINIEDIRSVS